MFNTKIVSTAFSPLTALLLLLFTFGANGDDYEGAYDTPIDPGPGLATILVLGDSLSASYGIDEQQGWVNLLRQKLSEENLEARIVNASISGETSAGGTSRLPSLLQMYQPNIVIIELGGNDGLRGYPITSMRKQLQSAITMSQANGAQVLLLGMQIPPNYGQRYATMFSNVYRELQQKNDIALVPFFLQGVAGKRELMQADDIHPTAAAQPILLANVWPALYPLLTRLQVTNN
ncbi:GDSL-type esterase/lipase family protein [Pseudomaricurvus alcaniphilus]|uniref:GDSL-type esterase/lipase family protein n=1 Tax=Pseudomaricurvus alcaniphilus TaxID=1166482 RepID=UPI001A9E758D